MNDAERLDALLDLVDSSRSSGSDRGPELVILGLAEKLPKAGFRPTRAGWALLGDKGRAFRVG